MPTQAPKDFYGARADAPANSAAAEHYEAARLNQMRERLTSLSDEARSIRSQVPNEFEPDVERIQRQMQRLGERLSELSGGALMSSAGRGSPKTAGEGRCADPDEVIFLGAPCKTDDPWDEGSANALTQFYESGEPFFGAEAGCSGYSATQSAQREAAGGAWMLQATASSSRGQSSADHGPSTGRQDAPAAEPVWLNDRFAEIARRIEQSLAEIHPESSLLSLGHRFDQLEARMSSVLGGRCHACRHPGAAHRGSADRGHQRAA